MFVSIMLFLDREDEVDRLDRLLHREDGGLAVVYGRRRIGKTRLLVEWSARHDAVYTVADESAPAMQRRYFAQALAERLPGFGDVEYPDWRVLFDRLAAQAQSSGWRGPLVIDELPYLVVGARELPSMLQRWIDHAARRAALTIVVAGSSQRMMQGLVLDADAPLYGRAQEILKLEPLPPSWLASALPGLSDVDLLAHHACWGGVPRYWELAQEVARTGSDLARCVDELVLQPLAPLHREPDRLLLEEMPAAMDLRPVLDAIGGGAHRVSEIGSRLQRPATSLSRPLVRLQELGLVRREVPFGVDESRSKRTLYRIDDPLCRLWFRVVAPHRAVLTSGTEAARLAVFARHMPGLLAAGFEELVRAQLAKGEVAPVARRCGPLAKVGRWWHGQQPEWDCVGESLDGRHVVLGEAKWSWEPFTQTALRELARRLGQRAAPDCPAARHGAAESRFLFVPRLARGARRQHGEVEVVTAADLLGS